MHQNQDNTALLLQKGYWTASSVTQFTSALTDEYLDAQSHGIASRGLCHPFSRFTVLSLDTLIDFTQTIIRKPEHPDGLFMALLYLFTQKLSNPALTLKKKYRDLLQQHEPLQMTLHNGQVIEGDSPLTLAQKIWEASIDKSAALMIGNNFDFISFMSTAKLENGLYYVDILGYNRATNGHSIAFFYENPGWLGRMLGRQPHITVVDTLGGIFSWDFYQQLIPQGAVFLITGKGESSTIAYQKINESKMFQSIIGSGIRDVATELARKAPHHFAELVGGDLIGIGYGGKAHTSISLIMDFTPQFDSILLIMFVKKIVDSKLPLTGEDRALLDRLLKRKPDLKMMYSIQFDLEGTPEFYNALKIAAEGNYLSLVELFLQNGAKPEPYLIDWAKKAGKIKILNLFNQYRQHTPLPPTQEAEIAAKGSWGLPGAEASPIDLRYYVIDDLGFLSYAPPLSLSSSIIEKTSRPATQGCFYQWHGILQHWLPKTAVQGPSYIGPSSKLMQICPREEHVFQQVLFRDSQVKITQTHHHATEFSFILGEQDALILNQFEQGLLNSLILGMTEGLSERHSPLMRHLLHCGIIGMLYGPMAVFIYLGMVSIQHLNLGLSESRMRDLSLMFAMIMSVAKPDTLSEDFAMKISIHFLASLLGNPLGKQIGKSTTALLFGSPTAAHTSPTPPHASLGY